VRDRFLLDPDIVFLNHGSFGACPAEVLEVQWQWQCEMERNPVAFLGRRSAGLLREARQALAGYLGANADDLVFVTNATTGVNAVARSLDLRPGDEVLTTDLEYGACLATWTLACRQQGARLRQVPVHLPFDADALLRDLAAAITPRTRLLFVSHIASTTALIMPVAALVAWGHAQGLPVFIDGAHAPGQLPLDLDALGADYYAGNAHKWLCAPKGSAFLHVHPSRQAGLHAPITSWGEAEGSGGHTGFEAFLGRGVLERRFQWQGTRDPSAFLAVPAAIDFQRQHDWPTVRARCHQMAMSLMHRVADRYDLAPIGPDEAFAQMAPLPVPATDPEALRARLWDAHRIEVPVTRHDGRTLVRVSVQAYNGLADLQALEAALQAELPA